MLQDFSLHRSTFHVGETNGGLALAGGNQEDAIKNDLASRFCSFTEVNFELVAFGNANLGSTVFDDGVHICSMPDSK